MKIFVDINIFLDLILKRDKFHDALLIFNAVEHDRFLGVILDITCLNIDCVAKKQVKSVHGFIRVVNNNFNVVGMSNEMVSEFLETDNNDLEDTLQYLSAKCESWECVITNDSRFYVNEIETLSSEEFVKKYLK